jgi:MFS family permease
MLAYSLTAALSLTNGAISSVWAIYMVARGASLELIGLSYTSFAIISLVLAPVAGRVSDRRGRFAPVLLAMALYVGIYAAYAFPISALALVLLSAVEGISGAVARSAVDGLLADVAPPAMRGRAQANYSAAGTGAAFVMALLSGALYGIYPGLPFAAVALAFLFTTLALFLPPIRRRFPARPIHAGSLELELEALERQ